MKNATVIFFVLFFISCSTDSPSDLQNGIVSGIVSDKTTDAPIAGATVYLLANDGGGTWGSPTPSFEIAQTTSDANGNFSFDFDYTEGYTYYCSAVAPMYFNYGDEFSVEMFSTGGNNVKVELQPIGYLHVHIKSVNEYEPSDFIGINSTPSYTFYGNEVDTNIILSVNGNSKYELVWFIYINGINDESESAEIYCSAFDTTFFEILY